jgi:hypothetical protein
MINKVVVKVETRQDIKPFGYYTITALSLDCMTYCIKLLIQTYEYISCELVTIILFFKVSSLLNKY